MPGSGAYRILLRRSEVRRALTEFAPDVLEVHDQTTLTWLGRWVRSAGVPSILYAHDHTGHLLADLGHLPQGPAQAVGRSWCRRLAARFHAVVCASDFSADPFRARWWRWTHWPRC
jgi:alpha-1,6-mannosyltransferase